jgi:hypothetical protein
LLLNGFVKENFVPLGSNDDDNDLDELDDGDDDEADDESEDELLEDDARDESEDELLEDDEPDSDIMIRILYNNHIIIYIII